MEGLTSMSTVPVSVFTGYLGAGKTTIILDLIEQLPKDYRCVWLKNEFGDAKVDSTLAASRGILAKEITNGCFCCVLVGQLDTAIREIVQDLKPDRIIIETSGSAYPAPLAWEIRKMANLGVHLDGIVTVVDCLNFPGYQDKSYSAKVQAKYTDLILLNKAEHVSNDHQIDRVLDDLYDVNPETPKVRTFPGGHVNKDLVFGLDSRLFQLEEGTISCEHLSCRDQSHMANEVELLSYGPVESWTLTRQQLVGFAESLDRERVFRAKGVFHVRDEQPAGSDPQDDELVALNYVAGRYSLIDLDIATLGDERTQRGSTVVLMGEDLKRLEDSVNHALGLAPHDGFRHTSRSDQLSPHTCSSR